MNWKLVTTITTVGFGKKEFDAWIKAREQAETLARNNLRETILVKNVFATTSNWIGSERAPDNTWQVTAEFEITVWGTVKE